MLNKGLIIIISVSIFMSCGFKELKNLNNYDSSKNKIENPYFSNKKMDYNYKVKIEINKKIINGIISIKKLDSIHHRIAFTSGFGYKIFDLEISENDSKWNSINNEINKKYIKKLLSENITNLISGNNKINYTYQKNNKLLYSSREGIKESVYLFNNENMLIEIYNEKNGFKKSFISFKKIKNNLSENITILNFQPSIKINLTFLDN